MNHTLIELKKMRKKNIWNIYVYITYQTLKALENKRSFICSFVVLLSRSVMSTCLQPHGL
mgnify:CR=1 FL=1